MSARTDGFNPHPREGGDAPGFTGADLVDQMVSIRTPVKGVIRCCPCLNQAPYVSIRTPVKGVIKAILSKALEVTSFNPHPREGGDVRYPTNPEGPTGFNPHPREGGDPGQAVCDRPRTRFNPHPREGGDTLSARKVAQIA